jgi:hypothetical protein
LEAVAIDLVATRFDAAFATVAIYLYKFHHIPCLSTQHTKSSLVFFQVSFFQDVNLVWGDDDRTTM